MLASRSIALASVAGLTASTLATIGASTAFGPAAGAEAATPSQGRPNVVMITADDASVVDLRYMPHTRALLQARGVTLTNAIAPTPICVPARASLLTGQYADNHGAVTISGPRGGFRAFNDANTLPVWLRRGGYSTMFAGKYLNGYGEGSSARYVPPGWSDWRGSARGTYAFFGTTFNVNRTLQRPRGYSTDVITDYSVAMLNRQHRASSKPFFLWANYVGPHHGGGVQRDDPRKRWPGDRSVWLKTTAPAPRDVNRFRTLDIPPSRDLWEKDLRGNRFAGPHRSPRYRLAMREVFQQRVEALQSVDRGVARIIGTLRTHRDLRNTYVIFASDNGYLTGHHNQEGKLIPYDKSVRIPMVIRGPGVPQGTRLGTSVTNVDIPVSIAAAAGVRPGRAVDGVPVFDMLRERAAQRPIPLSGWMVKDGRRGLYRGIRYGALTFVRSGRAVELYDRSRDPGELTNVAGRPGYAAQLRMMRGFYQDYARCRASSCPKTWS